MLLCVFFSIQGTALQEVLHCQWCVELWRSHVRDMESGTQTIWRIHKPSGWGCTMALMVEYITAGLNLIPRPCCVPPTWPGYETTSGLITHNLFTCFSACVFLFLQSMQLIESGCRLAPPPGCHRALYRLMIHCWWVHGVNMGHEHGGMRYGGMRYGVWAWENEVWGVNMGEWGMECGHGRMRYGAWAWGNEVRGDITSFKGTNS